MTDIVPELKSTDRSARYQLKLDPDGRSWTARENLADVLERELLGPMHGDEEELEATPDSLYLIGRIAPAKLLRGDDDPTDQDSTDADSDDAPLDIGDALDALQSTGVPVTAVDDSSADADTDSADDQPQKRGLMIPASMGIRFQIPADLTSFLVRASWGAYNPAKTERLDKLGNPVRVYRRTPKDEAVRIPVADLVPGKTTDVRIDGEVMLRIDTYPDRELDRLLVEVALCNDRETPPRIPVNAWMFQTRLYVEADGAEVFLPVHDLLDSPLDESDDELRRLNLQYRDRLEFAIGRTCSVDWQVAGKSRRASKVWTTWLPTTETPQTQAREIEGANLDMLALAEAATDQLESGLRPIIDGYVDWLEQQAEIASSLPGHLREDADEALHDARLVATQLRSGLDFLLADAEAQRCFTFMNRVMAEQRIQSQVAADRAADPRLGRKAARSQVLAEGPQAHSWRTFQLAFVLMQIEALSKPELDRRSHPGALAKVELLFFPTGGGKTEAYLGLAAYAFGVRRRQGLLDTPDGPLDGRSGIAVLMRYTLRLLTAQQFQRATTLVCAAELERRKDPATWGDEPFRIGLWVGTDVSPKRFDEAKDQIKDVNRGRSHRLTVLQIQRCPWCGTRIEAAQVKPIDIERRVHVYCGDDLGECPFSAGGAVAEGLPVLTVDEEIYRLAPAFVIATVDKFARLAREPEAAALFGYVRKRCDRHGYVHDDYRFCEIADGNKHPAKDGYPAATVRPATRLRPPDLVIQDELHLITGALGTTVGLFEVAIDALTTWRSVEGTVKPMIVASTATVRNASEQIRGLYGRGVTMFPPQVLDVADTYFSREIEISEANPGRRYVGLSTTGVRLTSAEIKVAEVLMAGAQLLLDRGGDDADPYLTLVGYFSATRELAGMARYMQDDIQTALSGSWKGGTLPYRHGTASGYLRLDELTSRVSSADITRTLDEMAVSFDPAVDSTQGRRRIGELIKAKRPLPKREVKPYDVILATSMLQVGVDVSRLGLMIMVGQPKNTAEYIQASSRVGRVETRPGLVVTLGNWARPRDLAHYEQFRHYHETFYAQVEPLSVTPFSITAIERGLDGVLVSAVRVLQSLRADGLSGERDAWRIEQERDTVELLIDRLVARATQASDETSAAAARHRLRNLLGEWVKRKQAVTELGLSLVYERVFDESRHRPLMISAEAARARTGSVDEAPFVVANSMREVQPEINLLVSPDPERLYQRPPNGVPAWSLPPESED